MALSYRASGAGAGELAWLGAFLPLLSPIGLQPLPVPRELAEAVCAASSWDVVLLAVKLEHQVSVPDQK